MAFAFDLISDLHVLPEDDFSWEGQATSLIAIVAGDVSKDRATTVAVLKEIASKYRQVFYLDGNTEHRYFLDDIPASIEDLENDLNVIENLVYLNNKVVISNGIAILGTNGWWDYEFDQTDDIEQSFNFVTDTYKITRDAAYKLLSLAYQDAAYLTRSIEKLQRHRDVSRIIVVTHTLPRASLVQHDPTLQGTYKMGLMGNAGMQSVLDADTEKKITHWLFGHYHGRVDQAIDGVRYINNPRGRASDVLHDPYHPLRISIQI